MVVSSEKSHCNLLKFVCWKEVTQGLAGWSHGLKSKFICELGYACFIWDLQPALQILFNSISYPQSEDK